MQPEQSPDSSRLSAAQSAAEEALSDEVADTAIMEQVFNLDHYNDWEQMRVYGLAHHAQAADVHRAITDGFPDLRARAAELWNEIETALQELEGSKDIKDNRRALKIILMNEARLAKMLMRAQPDDKEE